VRRCGFADGWVRIVRFSDTGAPDGQMRRRGIAAERKHRGRMAVSSDPTFWAGISVASRRRRWATFVLAVRRASRKPPAAGSPLRSRNGSPIRGGGEVAGQDAVAGRLSRERNGGLKPTLRGYAGTRLKASRRAQGRSMMAPELGPGPPPPGAAGGDYIYFI
jgi:hypothetical protein